MTVSSITVQTFNSATALDTGTTSLTFTPKLLPTSFGSLSTADPTVGEYSALTATITVTTAVPTDGKVNMVFPKWDSMNSQSMTGSLISVTATLDTAPLITPTYTITLGTTQDTVTISNLFSGYTSGFPSG